MIEIGKACTLNIVKQVDFGVYLDGHELGQILLPRKVVPKDAEVGTSVKVFIYLDSEDCVIATTKMPKIQVGQFGYLKAIDKSSFGAFLDWGLEKDLLLPFGEQRCDINVGQSYLVYVYINHADDRIVASAKVDKFLDKTPPNYQHAQPVNLLIGGKTSLGYKAIIDNCHWGLLYHNQIFTQLRIGQQLTGFIDCVRDDNKIDLVLQMGGKNEQDKNIDTIITKLKQGGGFMDINDKTDADIIYARLSMSKKTFKKAIGNLYRQKLISIDSDGIRLVD